MGAILLLEARLAPLPKIYIASYYTLIGACAINLVYLLLLKLGASIRSLAIVQIAGDVIIETLLVYFTGIDKVFAYLYFATVIASALLITPRASYMFASAATVMLSGVLLAHFLSKDLQVYLPLLTEPLRKHLITDIHSLLPYLVFFGISLHVVAFLSNKLAGELGRIKIFNEEILQNMADGVIAVDRKGRIAFINPQARGSLKLPQHSLTDLTLGQLPTVISDLIYVSISTEGRIEREIKLHDRLFEVKTSVLIDRHKMLRGVIVILTDITHRIQLEQMEKKAERFKALLEFSTSMAHEIRNPMASIRGAVQELHSEPTLDPDNKRLMEIVLRESTRLEKTVQDFLQYAREVPIEVINFDLSELLQKTIQLLRTHEKGRGVDIEAELPSTIMVRGSPDQLQQVFFNVGLNALHAVSSDGGRIRFRCFLTHEAPIAEKGHPACCIQISDNGAGIPKAYLDRVFDPFFSTRHGGIGMGLAIAQKIVKLHKGEIAIESQQDSGTTCTIWLPL
jgi:two-component system sensor histidine kinase PilS (NtrC family)